MKRLTLLLLFFIPFMLIANERSQNEAFKIAHDFFNNHQTASTRSSTLPQLIAMSTDFNYGPTMRTASNHYPAFYIYNNNESQFVIVSGDERMKPVLAYSHNGPFIMDHLPANIIGFLGTYVGELNMLIDNNKIATSYIASNTRSYPSSVAPLLGNIMYNQGAPYNNDCPMQGSARSVTGCVATAMAQVIKYHQYPVTGSGSYSYTTQSYGLSASFNYGTTTFDWANMLPQYNAGSFTTAQTDAIATLMYACGVSVSMDYSSDESGAQPYDIPNALTTYFKYDSNIAYIQREYFLYDEWMNLIKNELSQGRPILYDGVSTEGGHEFVFDGYDDNNMVHVNWGWAGQDNGYFLISDLDPSSPGIGGGTNLGGGFSSDQGMNIGIQPPTSNSTYTSYFTCEGITLPSTTVQLGSSFLPTINELQNMSSSFTGDFALIFEANGVQHVISSFSLNQTIPTQSGVETLPWSNFQPNAVIPTSLADGNYVFYLATMGTTKNENSWSPVRGIIGSKAKYNVTIANNTATFIPYWGNKSDVAATIDIEHALYIDKPANFTLTYQNTNNEREFYGTIAIALIQNSTIIDFLSSNDIYMAAGQGATTTDIAITLGENTENGTLTAGDYQITPVVQWQGNWYSVGSSQNATISDYTGTSDVNASNIHLSSSQIETNGTLIINGVLNATGDAPAYIDQIAAAIFKEGESQTSNIYYKNVFIEMGTPYTLSMNITPNLAPGSYNLAMYKKGTDGEVQMSQSLPFTVKAPSGINNANADHQLVVYKAPNQDFISIKSSEEIHSFEIYNMTSQLLRKESISNSGTDINISISDLPAGPYILVLHGSDNIFREKFIK